MELNFVYPEGGYFYYTSERAHVSARVSGDSSSLKLSAVVTDYEGNLINRFSTEVSGYDETLVDIPVEGKRLGYYRVAVTLTDGEEKVEKTTGVGITTEFEALPAMESRFGLNTNRSSGDRAQPHFAAFDKMGIHMIRRTWPGESIPYAHDLKKYNLKVMAQWSGKDVSSGCFKTSQNDRFAPPQFNSAYQLQKACADYVTMYEFGNEFTEERNLSLSAEWHKDTGFARLSADPSGWYSMTGVAGVDINKIQEFYEQGVFDYTTFFGLHPYSFPNAPENPYCYWSLKRLEDMAKWMKEHNINQPVAATEVGYPALYDQTVCEVYSPGDMLTLDSQIDYVIRSWIIFITYGMVNVQLYNGPWQDGFGIMEKDGPAPWPAAMALCELVRQVDKSEYIGNLVDKDDPNLYYVVFRKPDGGLFALLWKVVYLSRSCEKHNNYAVDKSGATEADGTVKEIYDYKLHHMLSEYSVRDVMGNPINVSGNTVQIGERPIYIDGISEDIIPLLTDKTIFHTKKVVAKPLPSPVILGIQDERPRGGAYVTSAFAWGETRNYLVRVHNYSDKELNDNLIFDLPDGLTARSATIPIKVAPMKILEMRVPLTCDTVAECGVRKVKLTLQNTTAAPAIQNVEFAYAMRALPVYGRLHSGSKIPVEIVNRSAVEVKYDISFRHCGVKTVGNKTSVTLEAGQSEIIYVTLGEGNYPIETKLFADVTNKGKTVTCEFVIPIHYVELLANDAANDGAMNFIAGYNLQSTFGDDNPCGSLIGFSKPEELIALNKMWLDEEYLYADFDVKDEYVLCAKLGRRNNIDCDGVWLKLYKSADDEKPYRHFCAMPIDQAFRAEGASIKEIAGDVLFAENYSDYDISNATVESSIYEGGYKIKLKIRRDSIDMVLDPKEIVADIRVLNMNDIDWPLFYDTGKIVYSVI